MDCLIQFLAGWSTERSNYPRRTLHCLLGIECIHSYIFYYFLPLFLFTHSNSMWRVRKKKKKKIGSTWPSDRSANILLYNKTPFSLYSFSSFKNPSGDFSSLSLSFENYLESCLINIQNGGFRKRNRDFLNLLFLGQILTFFFYLSIE